MKNNKLHFQVPMKKMYRMIVDTDAKNEADDQFAIAHHLMTPMFDVKGIIATHFEHRDGSAYNSRTTMQQSYDEIQLVLKLMGLSEEYPYIEAVSSLWMMRRILWNPRGPGSLWKKL